MTDTEGVQDRTRRLEEQVPRKKTQEPSLQEHVAGICTDDMTYTEEIQMSFPLENSDEDSETLTVTEVVDITGIEDEDITGTEGTLNILIKRLQSNWQAILIGILIVLLFGVTSALLYKKKYTTEPALEEDLPRKYRAEPALEEDLPRKYTAEPALGERDSRKETTGCGPAFNPVLEQNGLHLEILQQRHPAVFTLPAWLD
ncbi:uncharacterized protein LOC113744354 [Larimichthys crocea]|uniref:uncharacterized protein LOC113744354 n=1 Tax=Larimichthys crocea TaxID=215358 RepID=UPI000F5EE401|nr:uncharacterized protein LOC113744354 [Larimichthys crocea]